MIYSLNKKLRIKEAKNQIMQMFFKNKNFRTISLNSRTHSFLLISFKLDRRFHSNLELKMI